MAIPAAVQLIYGECLSYCGLLTSVAFDLASKLFRIDANAFYMSELIAIKIPASVAVIGR
jgi:hypothetical protein